MAMVASVSSAMASGASVGLSGCVAASSVPARLLAMVASVSSAMASVTSVGVSECVAASSVPRPFYPSGAADHMRCGARGGWRVSVE